MLDRSQIFNSKRVIRLIRDIIKRLELDLSGLNVVTEAASGVFAVTPIIAYLAGAEDIIAITADSKYATASEVISETKLLAALVGGENKIHVTQDKTPATFRHADIITNLGFVRPLNRDLITALKPGSVIPLMFEAWEFRPEDLDLQACRDLGIAVAGTNEDFPALDVFNYSGWLCQKMIMDAQIELHRSKIMIIGSDKFSHTIYKTLGQTISHLKRFDDLTENLLPELEETDGLVIADFSRTDQIVGRQSAVSGARLAQQAPDLTIIQFAGDVDVDDLKQHGLTVYPEHRLGPQRMSLTLGALGPRPVIDLHAGGLKVGELLARKNYTGRFSGLIQPLTQLH